jgi:hypothetical protein
MSSPSTSVAGITGTPAAIATAPRAGLVAQRAHRLGGRPDEGDARRRAGVDEIGVLGQQAIARMDRIAPDIFATRMISGIDR